MDPVGKISLTQIDYAVPSASQDTQNVTAAISHVFHWHGKAARIHRLSELHVMHYGHYGTVVKGVEGSSDFEAFPSSREPFAN